MKTKTKQLDILDSIKLIQNKWKTKEPIFINKKDNRYIDFKKQIKRKGFCASEIWDLAGCISEFIIPRLQEYKEKSIGHTSGLSDKTWQKILDKILFAFIWYRFEKEITQKYNLTEKEINKNWKKQGEGIKLFAEYFSSLWY